MKYNIIRFLTIFLILILVSTSVNCFDITYCFEEYNGEIEHLVIGGIISYPSIFSSEKDSTLLEEENITPSEFLKILKALHRNNYVLVKISDCFELNSEKPCRKSLLLPKGKRPVILSIQNVVYGKTGHVNRLIVDDGIISSYTSKRSINERIHRDKEFITILENYVSKHPDFSINNAKGLIMISGSEGMFGYKTQKTNANSKYQTKKCSQVISTLKTNGWEFCALNYDKKDLSANNLDFASGINKWNNIVKPLIGSTPIYYFGEDYTQISDIKYKSELLSNCGFRLLINDNFETKTYTDNVFPNSLIINSKKINGATLRKHRNEFLNMFDSEVLYDRLNRKIPF